MVAVGASAGLEVDVVVVDPNPPKLPNPANPAGDLLLSLLSAVVVVVVVLPAPEGFVPGAAATAGVLFVVKFQAVAAAAAGCELG